jgi:hypothetical protein
MDHIRVLPDTPLYDIALAKGVLSAETNLLPADADEFHALFYREPGSRLRDLALRALGSLSGKGYAPKQ